MAEGVESGPGIKADWEQLAGRVIAGKYLLEQHIGSGSTGAVYRARHTILEKAVALKILDPDLALSGEMVELFKHEAKAASRLDHPNSVRILDFGSEGGTLLYIAMEFVEGPDLLQFLEERFPLEHRRIVDIMSQILGALAQAHELGVIHRDLKPENVLVLRGKRDDGQAADIIKVCDFGVAQLSPMAVPAVPLPRTDLAHPAPIDANYLVGTPEYMSPEQARAEALDPRSDVYAAGVVLFQLLTGRLPFEAATPGEVATLQCYAPVPRPSSLYFVPAGLEAVCLTALNKNPAERYQSAREMRAALLQAVTMQRTKTLPLPAGGLPAAIAAAADTMSPPLDAPARKRLPLRFKRPIGALAGMAVLATVSVAGAFFATRDPSPPVQAAAAAARPAAPAGKALTAPSFNSLADSVVQPSGSPTVPAAAADDAREPAGRSTGRAPRRAAARGSASTGSRLDPSPAIAELSPGSGASAATAPFADDGMAFSASADLPIEDVALGALAPEPEPELAALEPEPLPRAKPQTKPIAMAPLLANVRIDDVTVRGSVATSVVQRAINRARARFSECYGRSARAAGRNGFGPVQIEVEFDEYGRARRSRADGGALPGLDRCINEVASKMVTASPPDTGTIKATWRVAFVPK